MVPFRLWRLLSSRDFLLTHGAAEWAKTNPDAVRLLARSEPTDDNLTAFMNLIQESFPHSFSAEWFWALWGSAHIRVDRWDHILSEETVFRGGRSVFGLESFKVERSLYGMKPSLVCVFFAWSSYLRMRGNSGSLSRQMSDWFLDP